MGFWSAFSTFSPRVNEKVKYPGKSIEDYLVFKTEEAKEKYYGKNRIPMETFHEMYFDDKVDFKGDALDILEYRHDWASFRFTMSLYWFFLTGMIPEVIMHTRSQGCFSSLHSGYFKLNERQMRNKSVITMTVGTTSTVGSWVLAWSTPRV